jgi:hypothetical protein
MPFTNPRIATITGVDDTSEDGNIGYNIQLESVITTDNNYIGLNPIDVAVLNNDNDATLVVNTGAAVIEASSHVITAAELNVTDIGLPITEGVEA